MRFSDLASLQRWESEETHQGSRGEAGRVINRWQVLSRLHFLVGVNSDPTGLRRVGLRGWSELLLSGLLNQNFVPELAWLSNQNPFPTPAAREKCQGNYF